MIVGICGMGYSGSGAVVDLLREYNEIDNTCDLEFSLAYQPDSIMDLDYHLHEGTARFFSSDVAIKRFRELINKMNSLYNSYVMNTHGKFKEISDDYINSITQCSWRGHWEHDIIHSNQVERTIKYRLFERIADRLQPKLGCEIHGIMDRRMYFSSYPKDFITRTQKYIEIMLQSAGVDLSKIVLLDQAFPANNPVCCMKYFGSDSKAIVIDKDPRDTYVLLNKVIRNHASWIPHESVYEFIEYYKGMRNGEQSRDNILRVHFEDLIYDYDNSVRQLEKFLGIREHVNKGKYFVPEKSRNNTQLFRKYPELADECAIIENELAEYVYDFKRYPAVLEFGESF